MQGSPLKKGAKNNIHKATKILNNQTMRLEQSRIVDPDNSFEKYQDDEEVNLNANQSLGNLGAGKKVFGGGRQVAHNESLR